VLALAWALVGAACSTAPVPQAPGIHITTGQGTPLSQVQALAALRRADHVLLGEVHDNPIHHRERAALLAALADRRPTVVFEQFARSADAALATPAGGDLEAWVARAGLDRRGWAWPLHRPLIEAALAGGLPLRGGNLERDEARQIARQGAAAAPADLAAWLAQPLPAAAAAALDQGLLDGHCGQLPAAAVPRMRDAQAARDVAMADALLRAAADRAAPTVLIAGNGHVRRDHGVALWLARREPAAKVVSVGFLEAGADGGLPTGTERAVYDIVWVTPRQARPDPCAGFSLTPQAPPAVK
jgi:uncharacterized iron-regulated protein